MKGQMYTPHFLKEFRAIGPVGEETDSTFIPGREAFGFQHPEPKLIEMTPEQNDLVVKGMWGVVNGGGTARDRSESPDSRSPVRPELRRSPRSVKTSAETRTTRGSSVSLRHSSPRSP
jgi:hypothetical protein